MPIAWTSDLSTGIDVIDSQHRRIVDYINQLESAITLQNRVSVAEVLDELVDYTLSHFAFEESLQIEAGYVYATPHKAIHDTFAKRISKYQVRHNLGEDISEQLHGMLTTWLVHHIKRDDMAYVSSVVTNIGDQVQDKGKGGWISRSLGRFFR